MRHSRPRVRDKRERRRQTLTGTSFAALALAMAMSAMPAQAQSFQATAVVPTGGAIVSDGLDSTFVLVNQPEVVIDWIPTDTASTSEPLIFQPAGTQTEYINGSGISDSYTVLNRIVPVDSLSVPVARPIRFDGTVTSRVGSLPGGNIWFYSPTGIIVGADAIFDVGSLVLTTNEIDTSGGLSPGGTIRFAGPAASGGFIDINAGAQISAAAPNSAYVALVAPRVVQNGLIDTDGSTALVAAEQVDVTVNMGLLDIVVLEGTTDANGIVHGGVTTGPATGSAIDQQQISMIAIPKNDAITMLVTGTVGYDAAVSVIDEGGSVVLSADYAPYLSTADISGNLGNVVVGNTEFLSPVTAVASNSIELLPDGGSISFAQDSEFTAFNSLTALVEAGEAISAQQLLTLTAAKGADGGDVLVQVDTGTFSVGGTLVLDGGGGPSDLFLQGPGLPGSGGSVEIAVGNGGAIIAQSLRASADGIGGDSEGVAGDGLGGVVAVLADGGTIATETLFLGANGSGGSGVGAGAAGGAGTGGGIQLTVTNGGTIGASNFASVSARGSGGSAFAVGGNGVGGSASIIDDGGTLNFASLDVTAGSSGGIGDVSGGDALSGSVSVLIGGQSQSWGTLYLDATAFGGEAFTFGSTAGNAQGAVDGGISLRVTGGQTLDIGSDALLFADAFVGVNGGPGSFATAGNAGVRIDGGASLNVEGSLVVSADAGIGQESLSSGADSAPALQGGFVDVTADGGTITAAGLLATTDAGGVGALTSAGNANGGTTTVAARNGGALELVASGTLTGELHVSADAFGGTGPMPADAFGGSATLLAEDGSIVTVGNARVSASARDHGLSGITLGGGYDAIGGSALVSATGAGGAASLSFATLEVAADGNASGLEAGTVPVLGDGGTGAGGTAQIAIESGTFVAGTTGLSASGFGGNSGTSSSGTAFQSGDGIGGTAAFAMSGGTVDAGELSIRAQGVGGGVAGSAFDGEVRSVGGAGRDDGDVEADAVLAVSGGNFTATSIEVDASGFGGVGMSSESGIPGESGGDGGEAAAGQALVDIAQPVTSFVAGSVSVRADAAGGDGGLSLSGAQGNGGSASAGDAAVTALGRFDLGPTSLSADADGGAGASGGDATGGLVRLIADEDASGSTTPRSLASLGLSASGTGGAGITADGSGLSGAVFFTAHADEVGSALAIAGDFTASADGDIAPLGNGFTGNVSGAPVTVAGSTDIATEGAIAVTVDAGASFDTLGTLAITTPQTIAVNGLVTSGGDATITGELGVAMTALQAGGTTTLQAPGGAVVVSTNLQSTGPVSVLGQAVDIAATGALSFADADATAGDLLIETEGDLSVTTADATGAVDLASNTGTLSISGQVNGNSIALAAPTGIEADGNLTAASTLDVQTGGTFVHTASAVAGGATSIVASSGIAMTGLQSGGTTLLQASGGDVTIDDLQSTGPVTVSGQAVDIASTGALSFTDADATAGDLLIETQGDLSVTTADATGAVDLASNTGTLSISGQVNGNSIALAAPTGIEADGNLTAASTLDVQTGGAFVHTASAVAGGATSIVASSGIAMTGLQSGGTTLLQASGGDVTVDDLQSTGPVTVLGQAVDIASTGALSFADVDATAGDLSLTTEGDLAIMTGDAAGSLLVASTSGSISAHGALNAASMVLEAGETITIDGAVSAQDALSMTAASTLAINSLATGSGISASSADIAIGNDGGLGSSGLTQSIMLVNSDPSNQTFIGGSAQPGGYSLDSSEFARLSAGESLLVTVSSPVSGSAVADVLIDDLQIVAGATGNLGSGADFAVVTPGRVGVVGAVQLETDGASGSSITVTAGDIAVITDSGGRIGIVDAGGNPSGQLNLAADTIVAATSDTLSLIASASSSDEITALLDEPGVLLDDGYLQAGTITADVADALLIQNSGVSTAFNDRRGFSADAVAITTASGETLVAINGLTFDGQGQPVTGLDTVASVSINDVPAAAGGLFDPRSAVNGCVIGQACTSTPPPPPPPVDPDVPVGILLTEPEIQQKIENTDPTIEVVPGIEIKEAEPEALLPLVDEPVTGVGNDDLWEGRCSPDSNRCDEGDGDQ